MLIFVSSRSCWIEFFYEFSRVLWAWRKHVAKSALNMWKGPTALSFLSASGTKTRSGEWEWLGWVRIAEKEAVKPLFLDDFWVPLGLLCRSLLLLGNLICCRIFSMNLSAVGTVRSWWSALYLIPVNEVLLVVYLSLKRFNFCWMLPL